MSMLNDISCGSEDNERECSASATLASVFASRFPAGRGSFLGLGPEKKWYSFYNDRLQGEWDRVAELMMFRVRESGHPVFRATSPLSRGTLESKGGGQMSIHFSADGDTPSTNDLAQEDFLQNYKERVERLSQQSRLIRICTDAGFLTTVGVGQYFMTKNTEEFSQVTVSVACRVHFAKRGKII